MLDGFLGRAEADPLWREHVRSSSSGMASGAARSRRPPLGNFEKGPLTQERQQTLPGQLGRLLVVDIGALLVHKGMLGVVAKKIRAV